jgi:hypothetical protein
MYAGLMFFFSFCYFSVNAVKRMLLKEAASGILRRFASVFIWWIVLGVLAYLPLKIWHYACIDGIFIGMIVVEIRSILAEIGRLGGRKDAKKHEYDNVRQDQYRVRTAPGVYSGDPRVHY